ncbi:MAG: glycosyltransferase family 2 protein, partial [Calditrichaeota bacterium]
ASSDDSCARLRDWAEGKLDVWLPPDHPLRSLSHPPIPKPVAYRQIRLEAGNHLRENAPLPQPARLSDSETRLFFLQVPENLGFAGGNNVGLRFALEQSDPAYLWFLNNDAVVEPDTLSRLVQAAQSDPRAGIVGACLMDYRRPDTVQALGGYYNRYIGRSRHITRPKERHRVNYIVGASMLVSRDTVEQIGGFCEELFLYGEDAEYCLRAQQQGIGLAVAPEARVYHKLGVSSDRSIKDYYGLRNTLYINGRYCADHRLLTGLYFAFRVMKRLFRFRWRDISVTFRAIRDYRHNRMGRQL